MFKRAFALLGTFVIALTLILTAQTQAATKQNHSKYNYSQTPTIFLHGYGGGPSSANNIIAAAQKVGVAQKVLTAHVSRSGHVTLGGKWQTGRVNPLVQVLFTNNRESNYNNDARWVKNVLTTLQKRYHITKFNVVAHSMGNLALMYYEVNYGKQRSLPQLQKQADLAGHFDGILGMDDKANRNHLLANGKPQHLNSSYRYMLKHRNNYPTKQVDVMNIYGNLGDGSNSDGSVSNVSAQSLKYLLGNKPKSYVEHMIKGSNAQHSKLHDNDEVNRYIIQFLWGK